MIEVLSESEIQTLLALATKACGGIPLRRACKNTPDAWGAEFQALGGDVVSRIKTQRADYERLKGANPPPFPEFVFDPSRPA